MNKEEQLQRLLRLKRHERPPEGFAEEFLEKFQRRQRSEIMRRGVLSTLGDCFLGWLEVLRRPAVIWTVAGAYGTIMLALWLVPRPSPDGGVTLVVGTENVSAPRVNYKPATTISTPGNSRAIPASNSGGPGKRRTSDQDQDKDPLIGPEDKQTEPSDPPLRDL